MMLNFSNNEEFKELLRQGGGNRIISDASNELSGTDEFKYLYSLFRSMIDKYIKDTFKYILISEDEIKNIHTDSESKAESLFKHEIFIKNNFVHINSYFNILNSDDKVLTDNNDTRRMLSDISKNNNVVVFVLTSEGLINYFINGKDYGESIFYTYETVSSYNEKKPITELDSVLTEYREKLKLRATYTKFFVPVTQLKSLRRNLNIEMSDDEFINQNKQLLRNKPEDNFRDDLRLFLKEKLKIHFMPKELMLENIKRLDIVMFDENGQSLYFIEVKWVGRSINDKGQNFGTEYKAKPRIVPDAFRQSIGYITELQNEHQHVKLGYLAVFDARNEKLPDTGDDFTEDLIDTKDKGSIYRHKKLPDFRVVNEHPN